MPTPETLIHQPYTREISTQLEPEAAHQAWNIYSSEHNPLRNIRAQAMKNTLIHDETEFKRLMQDENVPKIVIKDSSNRLMGVVSVTKNFNSLPEYTPTHSLNVKNGDIPFFHGHTDETGDWPGYYEQIENYPESLIESHNQLLQKQARELPQNVNIPPISTLDRKDIPEAIRLIDSGKLWVVIDHAFHPEADAAMLLDELQNGLKELNQDQTGLLLHHHSDEEIGISASLSRLPPHDVIDSQGYWRVRVDNINSEITPENSAVQKVADGELPGKIQLTHVDQSQLGEDAKQKMIDAIRNIEHTVCMPTLENDRLKAKPRGRPYATAAVVDQELPQESIEVIVDASPEEVGLFTFTETDLQGKEAIRGYFILVTPQGDQNETIQEHVITQNPHSKPDDGRDYFRIAALVTESHGRRHIEGKNYAQWLNIVCQRYLPEGGWIFGDTDANLINLRLPLILLYKDALEKNNKIFKTMAAIRTQHTAQNRFELQMQRYILTKFE